MVLARSLAVAGPRSFVHVDRDGQVRSPTRFHALQLGTYATVGTMVVVSTALYVSMFGVAGVGAGGVLAVLLGWNLRRARRLQYATRLIVDDRIEEAIPVLESVRRSRICPRRIRALAEQNLGVCAVRRGRYEPALGHLRAAIALHGRSGRSPFARMAEYGELSTLVNLGQVAEARALMTARHQTVPTGDYLQLQHWVADLYICLAEGRHQVDPDALHDRARIALGLTGGAALLGLAAWAHHHIGDTDQAWHLLREALDRRADVPIASTLPRLHAWMEDHAAAATAAGLADDPFAAL